jgi:hypothetical protein
VTTGSGCAAVPLLFGPIGKWEMLGQMKKSEISGFMAANMKMTDSLLGSE